MRSRLRAVWTWAALCALIAVPARALAAPRAGVAAAVRGSVSLDRTGSVGVAVETGTPIFIGDRIETGVDAGLQILLLDETVFTLGPNSAMRIDEFVYDPSSGEGSLDAELVRGAFRFISGRIAKGDPDRMKVELPSGTIGIRGTMVDARVDPTQGRSLVVLAGPGEGNPAGSPPGHIRVGNAGVTRDVMRTGWGVQIPDAASPPSEPFLVPPDLYSSFQFDVTAPGSSAQGGSSDPQGGEDSASLTGAPPPASVGSIGGSFGLEALGPSGDALGGFDVLDPSQIEDLSFSMTTLLDLATLTGAFDGHFFYDLLGTPLQGGGSVDIYIDLDFNANVVGVQLLDVQSSVLGTLGGGAGATSVPFSSGVLGLARYPAILFDYIESGTVCGSSTPCNATVMLDFINAGSQIAGRVKVNASIRDGTITDQIVPVEVPITSISSGGGE